MACEHLTPMDPRVRRTRKLLQDALRALLCEKGFAAISVQDITERATVNRATFYAHYSDKQVLLADTMRADFREFMKSRMAEFPTFDAEGLQLVATGIIEFVGGLGGGCPAAAKEMGQVIDSAIQDELCGMFRHYLEEQKPALFEDYPTSMVATMFAWSIYGIAQRWSHGERKRSPEVVARQMVNLLLRTGRVRAAV